MNFKNGYNFIYEKKVENKRKLFASKAGLPTADDEPIDLGLTDEQIAATKLFYEKADTFAASSTGIPTIADIDFSLTIDGEEVLGPAKEPVPPVPPTPPTPSTLVAFTKPQTIKGFDFGNVQNGDTNAALDTFLLGLEVDMNPEPLMTGTNDVMLLATHIVVPDEDPSKAINAGVLFGGDFDHDVEGDMVVYYSTSAFSYEGITATQGYQNLTDGKYGYINPENTSDTYTIRDDESVWNGIFIGADVAEAPVNPDDPGQPDDPDDPEEPALTPVQLGDTFTDIHFNTDKSELTLSDIKSSDDFDGADGDFNLINLFTFNSCDDSDPENITSDEIAVFAYYVPDGSTLDMSGEGSSTVPYLVNGDAIGIFFGEGMPVYMNESMKGIVTTV